MGKTKTVSHRYRINKRGRGLASSLFSGVKSVFQKLPIGSIVNTAIDAVPIELNLPFYQYCGVGTNLEKRLKRGDEGINKLDKACKIHDIAYSQYSDNANRNIADKELASKAWERVTSSDASLSERAAALAVSAAMKTKTALGGGRRRMRKKRGQNRVKLSKRGGNISRRRRTCRRKKNSSSRKNAWSMLRAGRGLYLKPYQHVY